MIGHFVQHGVQLTIVRIVRKCYAERYTEELLARGHILFEAKAAWKGKAHWKGTKAAIRAVEALNYPLF